MSKQRTVLRGGRVIGREANVDIVIDGSRILSIGKAEPVNADRVIDLEGLIVAPGFVDAQINGGFDDDFTADPESIWRVGERLRSFGVTAFLPTLVSTDLETIAHAREVCVAGPPPGYRGAAVWGLHVEGPFLAPTRCGAHDVTKLRHPDPELVRDWSPATGVAMVTMAPELPGAIPTIRALVSSGVVVSLGHSDADHGAAVAGFDAGASAVTHLYNAMSTGDHRNPGLALAALSRRNVTVGMIVDHIHLHPTTTRAAWNALGPSRTMLVSDAIAAFGRQDGTAGSRLGDKEVSVAAGAPRLASGVLAGSVLSLDAAVRNLCAAADASAAEGVAAVTTVPAALLGRTRLLAPGEPGDLTILDENLGVAGTVVAGDPDQRLAERDA
jgi:N-acetylglucosamine-6-phosphate deacetylase